MKKIIAICGGIESAEIDGRVKTIEEKAAFGCKLLKTISFSGDLITIKTKAFQSSGLTSFTLPNSVTCIEEEAFKETKNLGIFTISENSLLQTIETACFENSAIQSIYFGQHLTKIAYQAFYKCSKCEEISFHPNIKIKSIASLGFSSTAVKKLVLPSSLTSISGRCFEHCNNMKSLSFEDNSCLQTIEEMAFISCTGLERVILPNSCEMIDTKSFSGCIMLNSFTHNLTTINSAAFEGCTSLESFNFSKYQNTLDPGTFVGCCNLVSFSVSQGNKYIQHISGSVFDSDGTTLVVFPPGQETAIIPSKTVQFADNAFAYSTKLKFVAFFSGSNLTTIGDSAFYQCKKLKDIRFPPRITVIKRNAFYDCISLKQINFPDSLEVIQKGSFIGCKNIRVVYCGTNIIEGENVFENRIEILVTDLYSEETFCSNKASKKLSYNCEIKPEFIKSSCKINGLRNINFISLISVLILKI